MKKVRCCVSLERCFGPFDYQERMMLGGEILLVVFMGLCTVGTKSIWKITCSDKKQLMLLFENILQGTAENVSHAIW